MRTEIIQGGQVLRQSNHNGRSYIEAPPEGAYEIRLTNNCPRQRLAVISVDGINVVDGETAGYDGPGYVLRPWETLNLKGWRRDDSKVAKFTFQPQDRSYSNRTGRGTKNTGVIGIAVFEEKARPVFTQTTIIREIHESSPFRSRGFASFDSLSDDDGAATVYATNCSFDGGSEKLGLNEELGRVRSVPCSASTGDTKGLAADGRTLGGKRKRSKAKKRPASKVTRSVQPESVELGTGYGKEVAMYTQTTEFERATEQPGTVIVLQYATTEKLIEWGVPVAQQPDQPSAFPASSPSVAPPPGWQAR
jgi:hypothetical protein